MSTTPRGTNFEHRPFTSGPSSGFRVSLGTVEIEDGEKHAVEVGIYNGNGNQITYHHWDSPHMLRMFAIDLLTAAEDLEGQQR